MFARAFMTLHKSITLGCAEIAKLGNVLFLLLGLCAAGTVNAAPIPKFQKFHDWSLQCLNAATLSNSRCMVSQMVKVETKQGLTDLLHLSFLYRDKDKLEAELIAPLELHLPSGLTLNWKGATPLQLEFSYCSHQGCVVQAVASRKLISGFKRATKAIALFRLKDQKGVRLVFSLKGFTKALQALEQRRYSNLESSK